MNYVDGPVLGIETSCDETSVGVVAGSRVLANVVSSQAKLHQRWGGVVPEVAARAHAEAVLPCLAAALAEAGVELHDLVGIGGTNRPGLVGALSVGLSAAKALSFSLRIPFVGIHHLEAHILSAAMSGDCTFPHVCLLVSGGHTEIIFVHAPGEYEPLGGTVDDAAGEAFDKVARTLGLGYPGGPKIEEAATHGDARRYPMPRGLQDPTFNFSFSGLKTAIRLLAEREGDNLDRQSAAASFQAVVTSVLADRALYACKERDAKLVTVVGGVAANGELRRYMAASASRQGIRVLTPDRSLCTDNAAMVAHVAAWRLARGEKSDMNLDALSVAPLPRGVKA